MLKKIKSETESIDSTLITIVWTLLFWKASDYLGNAIKQEIMDYRFWQVLVGLYISCTVIIWVLMISQRLINTVKISVLEDEDEE